MAGPELVAVVIGRPQLLLGLQIKLPAAAGRGPPQPETISASRRTSPLTCLGRTWPGRLWSLTSGINPQTMRPHRACWTGRKCWEVSFAQVGGRGTVVVPGARLTTATMGAPPGVGGTVT